MSGEEDDDVDSGWDVGEGESLPTRAVDSRRLLADLQGRLRESDTKTPTSPPGSSPPLIDPDELVLDLEAPPVSEPPTTRRATDDELRAMRARAGGSAIRLGGRKAGDGEPKEKPRAQTPDKATRKSFDQIHNRPTPPAGVPSGGRSLRLDAENHPRMVQAQQRRATVVNQRSAAQPTPASPIVAQPRPSQPIPSQPIPSRPSAPQPNAPRPGAPRPTASLPKSQPPLDLHLDIFDLGGDSPAPPSERKLGADELHARLEAVTRPPPPPAAGGPRPPAAPDLDSLPVDEMLATARSSRPPEEPSGRPARIPLAPRSPGMPRRPSSPKRLVASLPPATPIPPPPPAETISNRPTFGSLDDPLVEVASPESTIEVGDEAALSEAEVLALDAEDEPELDPIRERFERGDIFGAALRAEALLEQRPELEAAQRYLSSAREALVQMYLGRLGSGEQILRVAMRPDEIQGLSLDHRSGFLISLIDGVATLDEVLDMSGMAPLDALRLLYEMREQGVVVVDSMRS